MCNYNSLSIAKANIVQYGRVDSVYTHIYKTPTPNESIENIYCYAENTYFVEILSSISNYYKVNYNGITGYVKKSNIKAVNSTPLMPYPKDIVMCTATLCNLRASPNITSTNILTTIPKNTTNIRFIGRTTGEEVLDFGGTTWYYIEYGNYVGYIYNKYIESISAIYENTENTESIDSTYTEINPISNSETLIYIIILSIPFIIVLCILYFPPKPRHKTTKHKY